MSTATEAAAPKAALPATTTRLDARLAGAWVVLVVFVWLLLGLFSITVSSLGVMVSNIPTESGIVAGEPQPLRGDEYARQTPLLLGLSATGDTDFVTPLTNDPFLTSAVPSGPTGQALESVLFPDFAVMAWGDRLPEGPLFALSFWFTAAGVVALMPVILVAFGVRFPIAAAATLLMAITPVVAWWSLRPLFSIFPGVVAVACWIAAVRAKGRYRWLWLVLLTLIAAIALARIPWSYPPYSLPLSGALLAIGAIYLLGYRATWRTLLLVAAGSAVGAGLITLMILRLNEGAFEALSNTLYPGERRIAGQDIGLGRAFGAPFNGVLQINTTVVESNASEVSSAWSFAIILWLAMVIASWRGADRAWRVRTFFVAIVLAVGFSWFLIDWPAELGESIPGLNLVQPTRMGQIWGLIVVMAVALVFRGRPRWPLIALAGLATGVLLYASGQDFVDTFLPDISAVALVAIPVVCAGIVALVMMSSPALRTLGIILALVGATLTVYLVNPIQRGLKPMRDTVVSQEVVALAGDRDPAQGLWATDTFWFGSLLAGNGIPALSGETWTGPSDKWLILDPTGAYENVWNRGVSKTLFVWEPGVTEPILESPYPDDIRIRVDPCAPVLDQFNVTFVASAQPLTGPCLTERLTGLWGGAPFSVYERDPVTTGG